jgi:CRP-like cAMP-binding protein
MIHGSLCEICPRRNSGFCGALLEDVAEDARATAEKLQYQALRSGELIASRNQSSGDVVVICGGWGFRFLQTSDGRRQILKFLLPGDVLSANLVFEDRFRFPVKALTDAQVAKFPREKIQAKLFADKSFLTVVANIYIAENQHAEEMLAVLGQRSAKQRIAYLLLYLMKRISAQSVIREHRYRLPVRQQHIADAVGLTVVHVNRILGIFRDQGIIELSDGFLQVLNAVELERVGSIN